MPLEFVNLYGQVISSKQLDRRKADAKSEAARKKRATPDVKAFHKGWKVTAFLLANWRRREMTTAAWRKWRRAQAAPKSSH